MGAITSEQARLHLSNVVSPVIANVSHRDLDRLTVVKALPFLRLHSPVWDEDGRTALIASVKVAVEDDTPSLVLELVYEDRALQARDTLPGFVPDMPDDGAPRRRDETVPYLFEKAEIHRQIVVADRPKFAALRALGARLGLALAALSVVLLRAARAIARAARDGAVTTTATASIAHARH